MKIKAVLNEDHYFLDLNGFKSDPELRTTSINGEGKNVGNDFDISGQGCEVPHFVDKTSKGILRGARLVS